MMMVMVMVMVVVMVAVVMVMMIQNHDDGDGGGDGGDGGGEEGNDRWGDNIILFLMPEREENYSWMMVKVMLFMLIMATCSLHTLYHHARTHSLTHSLTHSPPKPTSLYCWCRNWACTMAS